MFHVIFLILLYITSSSSLLQGGFNYYGGCTLIDGRLTCVGQNYKGQLGINMASTTTKKTRPQEVFATGVTSVCCGMDNFCACIKDGKLYTWGNADKYQTGMNNQNTLLEPKRLGLDSTWNDVQCGQDFVVAKLGSSLYAWGSNYYYLINSYRYNDQETPTNKLDYVDSYSVGRRSVVAIKTGSGGSRTVWAWGDKCEAGLTTSCSSSTYTHTPTQISTGKINDCHTMYRTQSTTTMHYCKDSSNKVISWGSHSGQYDRRMHGSATQNDVVARYMQYTNNKLSTGQQTDWSDVKMISPVGNSAATNNIGSIYILTNGGKIYFGGTCSTSRVCTETLTWDNPTAAVELTAWGSDNAELANGGFGGHMVIKNNGKVYVIGNNERGQLGIGNEITTADTILEWDPPPRCALTEYRNNGVCTACGANTTTKTIGDLHSCTDCTCDCPAAYRNPVGDKSTCTKLPDCALNEYANGDGCTACGTDALNAAGDDPATVTTCTCPLNYFGNSGACTKCESSSVGYTTVDANAPTLSATRAQCEDYATQTQLRSFQGDVSTYLQAFQPKGCITVQTQAVMWNPSTTSTELCSIAHKCIETTTNTYVGTRLAGDNQNCTTCSCDAPCGIGNYGDNYGCSICAANTQAKAAGDLQSCTTCTCLCTADHYGNNGSCTSCANGYENAAGDSQLCTTCACSAKPPCAAGEYGNGNGCTACPANTMAKDAGDSQDCTVCSCQCQANHRGNNGVCTACSTGYSRPEGDDMGCTNCECIVCDANHFGDSGSCSQCPSNTQLKASGDSKDCTDCNCNCKENFYGNFGVCTSCPSNSTNAAGDSHGCQNCSCTCDINHYGANNSCIACLSGFTNPAGDLPGCQNCSCTAPPELPPTTPSTGTSRFKLHRVVVWVLGIVVLIII